MCKLILPLVACHSYSFLFLFTIQILHLNKKMNDVKKYLSSYNDNTKGAIKEAARITGQRQNEIRLLRNEISNKKELLRLSKIDYANMKSRARNR